MKTSERNELEPYQFIKREEAIGAVSPVWLLIAYKHR